MYRYVIKRILLLIPIIIGVSALIFFVMQLAPGSAVDYLVSPDATQAQRLEMTHKLGLDQPVVIRYGEYMWGLLHGNLGTSYVSGNDVFQTIMQKLPVTLILNLAAIILATVISVPLGIYSALHRGSVKDNAAMVTALIGLSMPNFWWGLLLILLVSLKLGLLPYNRIGGTAGIIKLQSRFSH